MGRKSYSDSTQNVVADDKFGRDELNLLEHSFSGADKKVDFTTKSLVFAREDRHPVSGKIVERSWRITFSAEYGRPTPKDDEVFLVLMKMSRDAGMMNRAGAGEMPSPVLPFSTYRMIGELGWPRKGDNYRAVDDALNRIGGIWIVAKNYWWDNEAKEFVDSKFHIIDHVDLYERDKYDSALKRAMAEGKDRPLSSIRWSKVMMESFQAGYVRKIDLAEYQSLTHPTAKKLYRYLGKHFYRSTTHSIDLLELAQQKLGYSAGAKLKHVKERITPAIAELEQRGIYGLTHQFNSSYGKCAVVFNAKQTTKDFGRQKQKSREQEHPLVTRLVKFGVDRSTAIEALGRLTPDRIMADIEHVEFEVKAKRVKSSSAGMLAQMLKSDEPWGRPQGFVSSKERELLQQKIAARDATKKADEQAIIIAEQKEEERRLRKFNEYMAGLNATEEAEMDVRAQGVFWLGEKYREALKTGDGVRIGKARHAAMYAVWRHEIMEPEATAATACVVQKSSPLSDAC